jgi:hypothetical protein
MEKDEHSSQTLYESKPVLLILAGVLLLVMFEQRFEFSGLLLIIAGTLIARLRLSHRLTQVSKNQQRQRNKHYAAQRVY